jgi:hypothetical protein
MPQLTAEELKSINDLQSKYNQTIFEIGALEAQIVAFSNRVDTMIVEKENLIKDLFSIDQKEEELTKSLQEKYGTGNINPQTGEITPIQQ